MREFLVCYDYGTGGVWWWITAASAEAIAHKFSGLTIFDEPPDWWNSENDEDTPHRALDDEPDEVLRTLLR